MRRLLFWATMASAAAAAYLMYKRGAPLGEIAQKTITNPMGTLKDEVRAAV